MHLRNQKTQRSFSKRQLFALLVTLVAVLGFRSAFLPGAEHVRTSIIASYRVPVKELSGLTSVRLPYAASQFAAVGDQSSEVVFFELTDDFQKLNVIAAHDFSGALVSKFSLCGSATSPACQKLRKQTSSDWEALHATEDGTLHVLQEHSGAIVSFRIQNPSEIRLSNLVFEASKRLNGTKQLIHLAGGKDPDMAEGIFVIDSDTIMATKEYAPAAIVRFVRQPGESGRDYYNQQHLWQWADKGCDISDLKIDTNGQIYLLSQTCKKIALVEPLDENSKLVQSQKTWNLPSKVKKPEALVLLGDNYFLIGSDRKSEKKPNLFLVKAE